MRIVARYRSAAKAAGIHSFCSLLVASLAAGLVFAIWYAYPYREWSGGRELFLLVVAVDVVCGPLLTLVLFNPQKPRKELWLDLSLVALIQLAALAYGIWTVWQARPLYLVYEIDRYKVIAAPDVDAKELQALPVGLKPSLWAGPQTVGIRSTQSVEERNTVLFEAAAGGRDYSARPDFYVPYNASVALKALEHAKPLSTFLDRYPTQQAAAEALATQKNSSLNDWKYLPVVARKDGIAILDKQGQIQGFLEGDGF